MLKQGLLPTLILSLSANFVNAQVTVVDASAEASTAINSGSAAMAQPVVATAAPQQSARNVQGELFHQLQLLQDEVMQLRGIVEEQQHLVRQLKQQRLDDYLSLDKRISELSSNPAAVAGASVSASASVATSAKQSAPLSGDETASYKAAYDLVRAQQFEEAKQAFSQFMQGYPASRYLPNTLYWLGELYLLDPDLESARQSFAQMLDQYPEHRKAPDAMFKLAKVYHLQGESAKSKTLLKRVVDQNGGSSAAKLAQDYLQKNF